MWFDIDGRCHYFLTNPNYYQQERVNLSHKLAKYLSRPPKTTIKMSGEQQQQQQQKPLTRSMSRRFYRFESMAEALADVLGRQQSDPNLWVFEVAWEVANKGKFCQDIS